MPVSLHEIPHFDDKISWVFLEYGTLKKDDSGVVFWDEEGAIPLPVASLALVMLGPGTKVTHRAVQSMAETNCLLAWVGEGGIRCYAHSTGGTGHANNLRRQARIWANEYTNREVVRRMYASRFGVRLEGNFSLPAIRGKEGLRVREIYARLAKEYQIDWQGRRYDPRNWAAADLPNRCLSAANSCLYGLTHAALVSAGYSPALGFIHTGRPLSFVYDIADLFKFEVAVPTAFEVAAKFSHHPERATRKACRAAFHETGLMGEILPKVEELFDMDLSDVPDPSAHAWQSQLPAETGPDDRPREEDEA